MKTENENGKKRTKKADSRPETVGSIWWAALAMLGVCIPLCAVLKSASIPFLVIGGAVLATMYVWNSGQRATDRTEQREVESLRQRVKELEERLANVEVINKFEERLAEKELAAAGKGAEKGGERADNEPPGSLWNGS